MGRLAGMTLVELHEKLGIDLIGQASAWAQELGKFPLLVKLLDARDRLSVQVHPDDDYAQEFEGGELGKSEMWLVLHAEPGAELILGVTGGTTPEAFREAAEGGRLEPCLHRLPVKSGDFVCVPSRSLHAILGGTIIAEIQQNSNVTYRVYDWGRDEPDRPLHIEQAMAVINFDQVEPALPEALLLADEPGQRGERLCRNRYFTAERWYLDAGTRWTGRCDGSTMEIWGVLEGQVSLATGDDRLDLEAVRFALLPAALGPFTVEARHNATLVRAYTEA
jgi:mannose-6-phosphate isomerase